MKDMRNKLQEVTKDRNKLKNHWLQEIARKKYKTHQENCVFKKPTQKTLH